MKLVWDMADLVAKRLMAEVMNSPRAMALAMAAVQRGMALKGQVDGVVETALGLLGIPTVKDVRKIARKLDVVQGSVDNVSARLDQALKRKSPRRRRRKATPRKRPAHESAPPGADG